jgi:glycosidase
VDPRAGTRADLKALVDDMHRRGMRLILDFAPNHVSNDHPFFKSAVSDPKSPYRDYFTFIHWPDQYETFFGVKALPQINNEHAAARQYVIDSATYWLEEYGIDGFRLDYAYGPSHDFWTDFYTAVKRANPDSFHFGEIVETPTLLRTYEGIMDGALDFNWLQMSRKVFAYGSADVGEFEQFLSAHEVFFAGRNFALPTFLDNHDMNRFLWVSRGDKRRLMQAAVCQFTLATPPVIYYGTEVALSQRDDTRQSGMEASRLPMLWGEEQDQELFRFYQRLIRLRRGQWRCGWDPDVRLVDPATGRYAYKRQGAGEMILVLFNVSGERRDFELGSGWKDAFDGRTLLPVVRLDPYGFLIARQR